MIAEHTLEAWRTHEGRRSHAPTECLNELRETGRMRWMSPAQGWIAEAEEVVSALARDGFEECKYTETRDPHYHSRGGVWQGSIGRPARRSAVWIVSDERPHLVFVDIDGEPLRDA